MDVSAQGVAPFRCPRPSSPLEPWETGMCIEGIVIDVGMCGPPHGPAHHCAQIRTGVSWAQRQLTLVTRERRYEDGERVSVVLGGATPEVNLSFRVNDVWAKPWIDPWTVADTATVEPASKRGPEGMREGVALHVRR